jgi:hypothetical protein
MGRDALIVAALVAAAAGAMYWLAPRRGPCPCHAERAWQEADGTLVCQCAGEMGLVRVPQRAPVVADSAAP